MNTPNTEEIIKVTKQELEGRVFAASEKMARLNSSIAENHFSTAYELVNDAIQYLVKSRYDLRFLSKQEKIPTEGPKVDDVYFSEHWQSFFARWDDGRVEPLCDSEEARRVAEKWGINFL